MIPIRRWRVSYVKRDCISRPDEVGNLALFLGSDLASYVSGAAVACHGGGEPPVFLHVVTKEQQ